MPLGSTPRIIPKNLYHLLVPLPCLEVCEWEEYDRLRLARLLQWLPPRILRRRTVSMLLLPEQAKPHWTFPAVLVDPRTLTSQPSWFWARTGDTLTWL